MNERLRDGLQIENYEIVDLLGTGGMGLVHKAVYLTDGTHVALKVLGPTITDPKSKLRFRLEAEILSRLEHDGITKFVESFEYNGMMFLSSEYVEGITFRRLIERTSKISRQQFVLANDDLHESLLNHQISELLDEELSEDEDLLAGYGDKLRTIHKDGIFQNRKTLNDEYWKLCCSAISKAAMALEHAHEQGVIHRDIKPENLMIKPDGVVKVIDFGVAKYREYPAYSSVAVGTPYYMSPEQISADAELDKRSDIYSLGLVLYELLTLTNPFSAIVRERVLLNVVNNEAPPLRYRNRSVPRVLESIVHKAISKNPNDRYSSMTQFAGDLEGVLGQRPVRVRPYRYDGLQKEIAAGRPVEVAICAWIYGLLSIPSMVLVPAYMIFNLDTFNELLEELSIDFTVGGYLWAMSYGFYRGIRVLNYFSLLGLMLISVMLLGSMILNHTDQGVGFATTTYFLAWLSTLIAFSRRSRSWRRNVAVIKKRYKEYKSSM